MPVVMAAPTPNERSVHITKLLATLRVVDYVNRPQCGGAGRGLPLAGARPLPIGEPVLPDLVLAPATEVNTTKCDKLPAAFRRSGLCGGTT